MNQKNRMNNFLPLAIMVSVLVHCVILLLKTGYTSFKQRADQAEQNTPIEITEIPQELLQQVRPKSKLKGKQIVESEDAGNDVIDPNAQYLSDKNQTAKQQTRAKTTDDFRKQEGKGIGEGKATAIPPPTGNPQAEAQSSELDVADGAPVENKPNQKGVVRDWRTLTLKDLSVGGDGGLAGATDDYLNDVAEGERTILSTREFRYFSYYHRIKELLRQFWKPNVERQLVSMWRKGKILRSAEMTTELLVLLDEQGSIQKISRLTSSGVTEVDQAAVEAFEQAGPFPNPPQGIIDKDGFVRIRWGFILKAEAGPSIQWRRVGGNPNQP